MRADGYLPIAAYTAIGDGRTVALVGVDGSIDWLCIPNLDSPSVFGAIVDHGRGGAFALTPHEEFSSTRRYLPGTNVLETTFETATGRVRVTDALTLPEATVLTPFRELARRVECLTGRMRLTWRVEPRFGHSLATWRAERRGRVAVAVSGPDAVAVQVWCGNPAAIDADGLSGRLELGAGERAMLALTVAHQEPLVFPRRDDVERRLDATAEFWTRWSSALTYSGPWQGAVVRSALAMKMLVFAPSGAIAAAATTSLPEVIGGPRNWDYRYCWIRDSTFTIEALLHLGCLAEARAFFWWFMHATRLTRPRLRVFHRLDGGSHAPERTLPLEGYRGSRPVRVGNAAESQRQLDVYRHSPRCGMAVCRRRPGIGPRYRARTCRRRRSRLRRLAPAGPWDMGSANGTHALHPLEGDVLGCTGSCVTVDGRRLSFTPDGCALEIRSRCDSQLRRHTRLVE